MKPNRLQMKVSGKYALFTDPMTKISGEKSSLMIPTYEALKGIVEANFWKPCLKYIIESVKILNPIRTERKGIRPIKYDGGNDLSYYTYLSDVSYLVTYRFEWNKAYPQLQMSIWECESVRHILRREIPMNKAIMTTWELWILD